MNSSRRACQLQQKLTATRLISDTINESTSRMVHTRHQTPDKQSRCSMTVRVRYVETAKSDARASSSIWQSCWVKRATIALAPARRPHPTTPSTSQPCRSKHTSESGCCPSHPRVLLTASAKIRSLLVGNPRWPLMTYIVADLRSPAIRTCSQAFTLYSGTKALAFA